MRRQPDWQDAAPSSSSTLRPIRNRRRWTASNCLPAISIPRWKRARQQIQLLAFGGAPGDKGSDAKRISLKRALAIRQLLIDNGVPSNKIVPKAMGGADNGEPDRVDVYVLAPEPSRAACRHLWLRRRRRLVPRSPARPRPLRAKSEIA